MFQEKNLYMLLTPVFLNSGLQMKAALLHEEIYCSLL